MGSSFNEDIKAAELEGHSWQVVCSVDTEILAASVLEIGTNVLLRFCLVVVVVVVVVVVFVVVDLTIAYIHNVHTKTTRTNIRHNRLVDASLKDIVSDDAGAGDDDDDVLWLHAGTNLSPFPPEWRSL
jgi:hypothetical protein